MRRLALPLTFLLAASAQAAPVRIEFWHAMDQGTVAGYAQAFNRSQSTYEVVPVAGGNYRELNDKLQAALKAGKAPRSPRSSSPASPGWRRTAGSPTSRG